MNSKTKRKTAVQPVKGSPEKAALFHDRGWLFVAACLGTALLFPHVPGVESYIWKVLVWALGATIFCVASLHCLGDRHPIFTKVLTAVLVVAGLWLARYASTAELWEETGIAIWPDYVLIAYGVLRFGGILACLIAVSAACVAGRELLQWFGMAPPRKQKATLSFLQGFAILGREAWRRPGFRGASFAIVACGLALPVLDAVAQFSSGPSSMTNRHNLVYVMSLGNRRAQLHCPDAKDAVTAKTHFYPLDSGNIITVSTSGEETTLKFSFKLVTCPPKSGNEDK